MHDNARILVVDDIPENVRLLEAVLAAHGYDVITAHDGLAALDAVRSAQPDLILLDVMMPELDGYAVCRTLREEDETAVLPVIMVTSSSGGEKTRAIAAGADDFIPKPFDHEELLTRVRSLLRIKRYHDTIKAQAAELADLNRTLEERVQEQVAELGRLRRLRRFLSPQLADAIVSSGNESIVESHRTQVAMFFADLRGWTSFVDTVEPEELMRVLREFHDAVGRLVKRFDATVGFLEGDGVQLFFNDPIPIPDAPLRAVRLGCALREEMAELTPQLAEAGLRPRLRRRHRARVRDLRRDRLRGPLRLRSDRRSDEPRVAAGRRGIGRTDLDRSASVRGNRGRSRRGGCRRVHAQGVSAACHGFQRRHGARYGYRLSRARRLAPNAEVEYPSAGSTRCTRVQGAAFFDLDRTLISRATPLALANSFRRRRLVRRRDLVRAALWQLVFLIRGVGEREMRRAAEDGMRLLRGVPVAAVDDLLAEAMEQVLRPLVYCESLELARTHHGREEPIYVISASLQQIVEKIAEDLGFEGAVGSTCEIESGVYTGRSLRPCYGSAKADAVREIAARDGIDLALSTAYSDSHTDVAFLESVGHPTAVNPDAKLRKIARERGWPILKFSVPRGVGSERRSASTRQTRSVPQR